MAGDVSLFVPLFEKHHFKKKKVPDRAAFASLLFAAAKTSLASSAKLQRLLLPIYFKLPPGTLLLWSRFYKITSRKSSGV